MTEVTPLAKPKRKPKNKREPNLQKQQRIVDPIAIELARKTYCQFCGLAKSSMHYTPHHIKTVASGGDDAPDNLICLCIECHNKAHSGQVKKQALYDMLEMDRRGS